MHTLGPAFLTNTNVLFMVGRARLECEPLVNDIAEKKLLRALPLFVGMPKHFASARVFETFVLSLHHRAVSTVLQADWFSMCKLPLFEGFQPRVL